MSVTIKKWPRRDNISDAQHLLMLPALWLIDAVKRVCRETNKQTSAIVLTSSATISIATPYRGFKKKEVSTIQIEI
jgi:hypothetical protein